MPFTAVADTLLAAGIYSVRTTFVRSRVEKSEQENLATNAVIPPAEMRAAALALRGFDNQS